MTGTGMRVTLDKSGLILAIFMGAAFDLARFVGGGFELREPFQRRYSERFCSIANVPVGASNASGGVVSVERTSTPAPALASSILTGVRRKQIWSCCYEDGPSNSASNPVARSEMKNRSSLA